MSWLTNYRENAVSLTAYKDIKVIMFLCVNNKGEVFSPYQRMKYCLGKKKAILKLDVYNGESAPFRKDWRIDGGYHSFAYSKVHLTGISDFAPISGYRTFRLKYGRKIMTCVPLEEDVIPFECIIPKGAKYYINERNYVVSETIIVKKPHEITIQPDLIGTKSANKLTKLVDRINKFVEDKPNK